MNLSKSRNLKMQRIMALFEVPEEAMLGEDIVGFLVGDGLHNRVLDCL